MTTHESDLHRRRERRLLLWVSFNVLIWLIWVVDFALTGFWFPWPAFYTVGSAIVIGVIRARGQHHSAPAR